MRLRRASSSSGRRLPGRRSVQQCRQARSQSRVSCHGDEQRRAERVDAVRHPAPVRCARIAEREQRRRDAGSTTTIARIAGHERRAASRRCAARAAPLDDEQRHRERAPRGSAAGNAPATTPDDDDGEARARRARDTADTARSRPSRTTRLRLPTRRSWWKSGIAFTTASAMMKQARHERGRERAPRERARVQVEAAQHHPRPVGERDHSSPRPR